MWLLILYANSLDPDQVGQFVRPDLGPELFDKWMVFLKKNLEKVVFENSQHMTKNMQN